ncbi:hypothetical protein [Actinokineospora iranica]|uniref:Uncharacterized protein n=1 Tax=Actinokineospora iranica TaxID=1271860 RepID=A0A1G6W1W1_9PSEU|nr:hypothetical protein [Actinokineospora iranica]SDD59046.1 hypothetical protein SAMN05216174_113182 [Actinokineospora iranica]
MGETSDDTAVNRIQLLVIAGLLGGLVACGTTEPASTGERSSTNQETGGPPGASGGSTDTTARHVVDRFIAAGLPAANPRDNTKQNCDSLRCLQLITTDAISVYSWPDETAAQHQVDVSSGNAYRQGTIVLSYGAARTPQANRPRYEAVLKDVVG